MAIDGSIIQFRDELNGNAKVYPLTYQNAVLGEDNQPLQTYITEYNVSHHHTNKVGTSETNPNYDTSVFTLSDAIATVPDDYKRGGLKLSFNSDNGSVESYTLDNSVWNSSMSYWRQFDVNKLTELGQKCKILDIIDEEPIAGSDNLVKSGSLYPAFVNTKKFIKKDTVFNLKKSDFYRGSLQGAGTGAPWVTIVVDTLYLSLYLRGRKLSLLIH